MADKKKEYRECGIQYTLGKRLGEGAFGEVFQATEKGGKFRSFAVKCITCTTNKEIESVIQEIIAMVSLHHANIVKMFDFGLHQEWQLEVEFSLLMEYCTRGSLNEQLGQHNSRRRKLGWIRSITSAVVYLHSQNIVHQDLKPDNILLTDNDVIKVADFGLIRHFARRNEGMYLTSIWQ